MTQYSSSYIKIDTFVCLYGSAGPGILCLSPGWVLAVSHPNQKRRVTGGHVWPPLRRITGSLSAPQATNGSPPSLWQQPWTLEGPQTGASKQMPIINWTIWKCQSCQSVFHGSRPSPRPVRGPLGWVKNDCPAVCVCECVVGLGVGNDCPPGSAWACLSHTVK